MKKRFVFMTLSLTLSMPVAVLAQNTETSTQESSSSFQETDVKKTEDTVTLADDCDVLDYPGRKEGTVIGEVLEGDEVSRTGTIFDIWSQIIYEDEDGEEQTGYIPTSTLKEYQEENSPASTATSDGSVEAGIIHKSTGEGVFAEAVEGVTPDASSVMEGQPITVSADSVLRPLGNYRITHYCQCSICCGPWANGVTSTGATATTNRTIAVDPTQIPYGSKVVINGQVYVAEDCGGAIKGNRIDIYVGSHAEAEQRGLFYTEVYLLEEGTQTEEENLEDISQENIEE